MNIGNYRYNINLKLNNSTIVVYLIIIAAVVMFRQIISNGYFSCLIEDTHIYTSWAWQFKESLREGILYPRWISSSFWGYGAPVFILYPPLAYYITSFYDALVGSFVLAMNITKLTALFLSSLGIFCLARELYNSKAAFIAALLYMLLPYTVIQYYFFGGFASVVSFFWFPFILLFIHKFISGKNIRNIIFAGLCYGGLILTHLINAYMFGFILVIFILWLSYINKKINYVIVLPMVILIGVLVSAAYLLPLIVENKTLQLGTFVKEGSGMLYDKYFILSTSADRGNFWSLYSEHIILHVLLMCIIALIIGYMNIKVKDHKIHNNDKYYIVYMFMMVLSIVMTFEVSSIAWEYIPSFKYIQIPLRWLNITIFVLPLLLSSMLYRYETKISSTNKTNFIVILLFIICVILDCKIIFKSHQFPIKDLYPIRTINYATEHMPVGVDLEQVKKSHFSNGENIDVVGNGTARVLKWKSVERDIRIQANQPITLRIRTFNFPGWTAYLDGMPTQMTTEAGTGAIRVDIPTGEHKLLLRFEDTPARSIGKMISVLTMILSILLITLDKNKYMFNRKCNSNQLPGLG